MNYFSMFSGIGGFELGIERAYSRVVDQTRPTDTISQRQKTEHSDGIGDSPRARSPFDSSDSSQATCIGYSEIDKYATKVYERRFNGHINYGDATKIDATKLPDFELLVGGFPCQAFSVAGKRAGFNDTRGTLFFDIARILAEKRPRHILLENVKGLLSHEQGKTFATILGVLADLGYRVEWQILNSKDFGVPQNRERVYIVGHLGNGCGREVFPILGTSGKDIIVSGILDTETWRKRHEQIRRVHDPEGLSPTLPTGTGGGVMPKIKVREATKKGYAEAEVGDSINISQPNSKTRRGRVGKKVANTLETSMVQAVLTPDRAEKRQNGRRMKEDGEPSFTLTGQDRHGVYINKSPDEKINRTVRSGGGGSVSNKHNWDTHKINGRIRRLTPLECERLQGFPDNWTEGESDTQRYKMCGNAVTVNTVAAVMSKLKECL